VSTGKTTTTGFAVTNAGPETTNPHDPNRAPGGSSTGSAVAIADVHIPLSLGVQSGGSVIHPASYTGIYAMKLSYNAIPPAGQSIFFATYDTNGIFARSLDDLQMIADLFAIKDGELPRDILLKDILVAIVETPMCSRAGPSTVAAMEKTALYF
jgi:Asp-tRNA(Asn)/Glu-tRNA(Gln) amidotransferase A subunit family amidase